MVKITNKGKNDIKSYSIKLSNDGTVVLSKTQKDIPISNEIEIPLEPRGSKFDIEIQITYTSDKSHLVKGVNFNPNYSNIEVTTYGDNKPLKINAIDLTKGKTIVKPVEDKNMDLIQQIVDMRMSNYVTKTELANYSNPRDALDEYFKEHPVGVKSAYESALDGGYTGTEKEFNQALAGVENMTKAEMLDILRGGDNA